MHDTHPLTTLLLQTMIVRMITGVSEECYLCWCHALTDDCRVWQTLGAAPPHLVTLDHPDITDLSPALLCDSLCWHHTPCVSTVRRVDWWSHCCSLRTLNIVFITFLFFVIMEILHFFTWTIYSYCSCVVHMRMILSQLLQVIMDHCQQCPGITTGHNLEFLLFIQHWSRSQALHQCSHVQHKYICCF